MTIGNPPKPPRVGGLVNALATITKPTASVGEGGFGTLSSYATVSSNVPVVFQEMSSAERIANGINAETATYTLWTPSVTNGGTDLTVKGANVTYHYTIDGVEYETVGSSVEQSDGWIKVTLRRIGSADS